MADARTTENSIKEFREKFGEQAAEKLLAYMDRILEINEHINLTAVRDRDEAVQKHLVDSLVCVDLPEYMEAKSVLDMGTGGGFPGVPLAIVSEGKDFTLVDSLLKRLKIIDGLAEELEISNVKTVHARAEDIGQSAEARENYDVVVSRAVASLDVLAEWCLPLVKVGGYMIAYKGENVSRETSEAGKAIELLGGKIERIDRIDEGQAASEEISGHALVVIKKIKNTPKKYPRKAGEARKAPIR